MVIIFWEFLMFYQFFLSAQVKRSMIISNKPGYQITELPMELYSSAQSSSQNENVANTSKRLLENRNWTFPVSALFQMKTRIFLKYFVRSCSTLQTPVSPCHKYWMLGLEKKKWKYEYTHKNFATPATKLMQINQFFSTSNLIEIKQY